MKRGKYERSDAGQPKEKVPPIKTAAAYLHDLSYLLAAVMIFCSSRTWFRWVS